MVTVRRGRRESPFTVSVEARHGVTTRISVADRALTVRALGAPTSGRLDFTQPGHVFSTRAPAGGAYAALEWPEAAVELGRFAGVPERTVVACQVLAPDGGVAAKRALTRFARVHALPSVSIEDTFIERARRDGGVQPVVDAALPTTWGAFRASSCISPIDGAEHLALVRADVEGVAVSVHMDERCLAGHVLASSSCDYRPRLERSLARMASDQCGVLVSLSGASTGIGSARGERIAAIAMWGGAAQIVRALGVERAWATGEAGIDAMLAAFGVQVLPRVRTDA